MWIGIYFAAAIFMCIPIIYYLGYLKEKNDSVYDDADMRANVNGIMLGVVVCFLWGLFW